MKPKALMILLALALLASGSAVSVRADAWNGYERAMPQEIKAVRALRPIEAKLHGSRVPVLLPSWLPRRVTKRRTYAFASVSSCRRCGPHHRGLFSYEADLSTKRSPACDACRVFFIVGQNHPFKSIGHKRRVKILMSSWGYFINTGSRHLGKVFTWSIGRWRYAMRCRCRTPEYVNMFQTAAIIRSRARF